MVVLGELMAIHIPTSSVPIVTIGPFYTSKAHIQDADLHVTVCIPSLWREPKVGPAHDAYNREVAKALHTIAADHEAAIILIYIYGTPPPILP